MKTKFLHIATALLFAGFTSSCSDFLDRYPLDELSDSSFWKTLIPQHYYKIFFLST